jgi:hypothetical protein
MSWRLTGGLVKVAQLLEQVAKTVAKLKIVKEIYIKTQFNRPKTSTSNHF